MSSIGISSISTETLIRLLPTNTLCCWCVAILFLTLATTESNAQVQYEFHQEGTVDVLARLELAEVPVFDQSEILRLELLDPDTPDFSLVMETVNLFDLIFDDDLNGLGRGALEVTPETTIRGSEGWDLDGTEHLLFEISEAPFGDVVNIVRTVNGEFPATIRGDWLLVVPEPSSSRLVMVLAFVAFARRRKKNPTHPTF